MLFNSLTFVVFFAIVLVSFWALRSWSARKTLLLVASYIFYGAWNPPFVLLLAFSTLVDFVAGIKMAEAKSRATRNGWLAISLTANLGLLGYFKYSNFLLENLRWALYQAGIEYVPPRLDVVLPVGISFYTFQTLSYTFDIFRGKLQPTRSFRDFAFFVSFFPQLVAGPIVRAADFMPQCAAPAPFRTGRLQWGLWLMTLGLFQKVVLADTFLASSAETIFSYPGPVATFDAWIGTFAFAGQIFFDFSGYSICAIGAALCLGFSLNDNFRFPYAAVGFSDFWRRWHISLSTFLRDYLYIPLGGNRAGPVRAALNLVIVMLLGGLWHGAAWTFVVWGLIHGVYLVIERVLRGAFPDAAWARTFGGQLFLGAVTYLAVCLAWVFFRSGNFHTATELLRSMFGRPAGDQLLSTREILQVVLVTAGLLIAHWRLRNSTIEAWAARQPAWMLVAGWAVMACGIILNQGNGNAFIYFQF